jgi:hypothetical protein
MRLMTRRGSAGRARRWRAGGLAAAVTAALLLLAYADRLFLARIVVEFLVRIAQMTG